MDLSRKIYIIGEIDEVAFNKFSRKMSRLESESRDTIYIELTSYGGDAMSALAFFDRIRVSPCIVSITVLGLVASAATLIFAAGDNRIMSRSSWIMVHEDQPGSTKNMVVHQVEKAVKHSRRLEDQWNELLASVTLTSAAKWAELNKEESFLSAKECVRLGLADKILGVS